MATKAGLLHQRRRQARVASPKRLDALVGLGVAARLHIVHAAAGRRTRARLGMLGVPLAVTAAILSAQWWSIPLLVAAAWWWAPRSWGWEWLVAIGRGLLGVEWAYLGAGSLAAFPSDRLIVGAVWAGLPAVLAAYSARAALLDLVAGGAGWPAIEI
jgi:hypothetical protein